MAPVLWTRFNCLKTTEPLRGGSLPFTTKFPEIPNTHFINLGRMKGWVDLRATQALTAIYSPPKIRKKYQFQQY